MRSPFKFLDAYTLADKDAFFGREQETDDLYRMVFKTPLLLIYGISGTGKTSLIQCGLASRFDGPDWFPIFIRRQNNINESLKQILKSVLGEDLQASLVENISYLYRFYLRPVYLIFDQFEELFILGNREEQLQFINDLQALVAAKLPCKVILTMREEYIGQLYDFEKVIPTLFDFRLRLEPMNNTKVKSVMQQSFQRFNIMVEAPEEERLQQMLDNLSAGKSGIQLPYLQVYLDRLYREDFQRTYTRERTGEELPPLTFTKAEIQNFGRIENVLEKFSQEQESSIQSQLLQKYPKLPPQTVRQVLDAFVTEEGTKRPIRFQRKGKEIVVDEKIKELLPEMPASALTECLESLERSRILRFAGEIIELAHDSLAALIDRQRTDQQRQLNELKRRLQYAYDEYARSGEYLSRRQLSAFEELLPQLRLEPEIQQFINDSRQNVEGQERAEIERQKKELRVVRRFLIVVSGVALIAFGLGFWAYQQNGRLKAQFLENVKANVNSFRNEGKYREAIAQIVAFKSNSGISLPELDTQLIKLEQLATLTISADSILNIPDTIPINDTLRLERTLYARNVYQQADSLYADANTKNKMINVNLEVKKLFEYYLGRAQGLASSGNCPYINSAVCKAQRLKPDDPEILSIMAMCGMTFEDCK